jgi:hypothetical protein
MLVVGGEIAHHQQARQKNNIGELWHKQEP